MNTSKPAGESGEYCCCINSREKRTVERKVKHNTVGLLFFNVRGGWWGVGIILNFEFNRLFLAIFDYYLDQNPRFIYSIY